MYCSRPKTEKNSPLLLAVFIVSALAWHPTSWAQALPADTEEESFTETSKAVPKSVDGADDQAHPVSQLFSDEMKTDKNYNVLIQYKNRGKTTWSNKKAYQLAPLYPKEWNLLPRALPANRPIAPGETVTFRFKITAPSRAGEYPLQWQMRQGHKQWFGKPTSETIVTVNAPEAPKEDAEFVYQDLPSVMNAGQNYSVTLQFKNRGESVWTPGQYALVSQNPYNNLTWSIGHIESNSREIIRPGGFLTFSFTVRAPSYPGKYNFQWQISHLGVGLFGSRSRNETVEVIAWP